MNSTTKTTFLILCDGVAPSELSKELNEQISDSGLKFSVEEAEKGNRDGLGDYDTLVTIIEASGEFFKFLNMIIPVAVKIFKNNRKKKELPPKADSEIEVGIKLKDGSPMTRLKVDSFSEKFPKELEESSPDDIEFLSIK